MNNILTVGGKLALICVIAALCLGLVNAVTAPAILRVKEKQLADALQAVSLEGTFGAKVEVDDHKVVEAYYQLSRGTDEGYILRVTAMGYGGDMDMLASFSASGTVLAVSLMDNQETPGLGKEAERSDYMDKFIGTGATAPVPTSKNQLQQAEVDAISGATITFIGIGEALHDGSDFVKSLGGTDE